MGEGDRVCSFVDGCGQPLVDQNPCRV
jgi:hypothetical protein